MPLSTLAPGNVVRAASAADVAWVLTESAGAGLRVTTERPPASSTVGPALLDLSPLQELRVMREARAVRVGAGVRWDRLVRAAALHELSALPAESMRRSAVADTLAGAVGPVARTFGLSTDHVLSLDVVTPDGKARTVTPDSDADLFGALCGSGAGLGVVTGMSLGLLPAPSLRAGAWWFDAGADAARVLHRWRSWVGDLPESMSTSVVAYATVHGPEVCLRFAHAGDAAEADALLAELRDDVPAPEHDTVRAVPSARLRDALGESSGSALQAVRGGLFGALAPDVVDVLLGALAAAPAGTRADLRLLGGAVAREPAFAGCVGGRSSALSLRVRAPRQEQADAVVDALGGWTTGGTTLGQAGPWDARTAAELRAAWGEPTAARLERLRSRVDPAGVLVAPWEPPVGR